MKSKPAALLFDLDGVLIDSEGFYTAFWDKTEKLFPTGIPDFAHAIKGQNLQSILGLFLPEERDEILRLILDFDNRLEYPMFPGAIDLLISLEDNNIPAALVTSSNPEKMAQLFRQYPNFAGYFATIIDGSMVEHGKPDPECYLLAAKKLGVSCKDCIVVEDSLQGIHSGQRAGATVYGLWTTLPREIVCHETPFAFATIADVKLNLGI